jgi:hypothetical protein
MASTYLSKSSYGTPTSTKIFTWSCWFKIGQSQGKGRIFDFYAPPFSYGNGIFFTTGGELGISGGDPNNARRITSRVFRDPNAWYHVVGVFDSPNATAEDRLRLYINGVRETSFSASVDMNQNQDYQAFRSDVGGIGRYYDTSITSEFFDGEMAHIHFIDGTVYDADTFGETDATTGIWKPKTAPSVTYGNNGFFLKFENSGAFGTDSSGNSNNFTVSGTMTQTIDTPSNVFATLNPLMGGLSSVTYSNGNTTATFAAPSTWYFTPSTLAASQGKWYAEVKVGAVGTETSIGIIPMETVSLQQGAASDYMGKESDSIGYVNNGQLYKTNSVQETTSTYTTGDIIGMAFDLDGNSIQFYKNGSSVGSAISLTSGLNYTVGVSGYNSSSSNVNFGNGYFGTTAVSSAQNPDDGIGIFEYDVPTGYRALCTKSINAEEYS